MTARPRDRAWAMAAVAIWMIATVGLVALSASGPILRPGVDFTPIGLATTLIVALSLGWPLLTATSGTVALVAGQGAIVLALDPAMRDRTTLDVCLAIAAWLMACGVAVCLRAVGSRMRGSAESVWASILIVVAIVSIVILG